MTARGGKSFAQHLLERVGAAGAQVLWLNADETSLAYQFEPRSGNRVRLPPTRSLDEYVERISLDERRCRATLIGCIAASNLPLPAEPPPQVFLVSRTAAGPRSSS